MSTFILYLKLGYRYIMDLYSVEQMLFVVALMAIYLLRDWKRAFVLLLFYMAGITLSLSFSGFRIINPNLEVIRYLIPLTIFIAAFSNIFKKQASVASRSPSRHIMATVFGIIHGFGLAGYLKNIAGIYRAITIPLLGFNTGVMLAFVLIMFLYLIISWIFVNNLGVSRRDWYMVLSAAIAGVALTLMFESRYWLD